MKISRYCRLCGSKKVSVSGAYTQGYFFFFQAEDGIRDYKVTGVPDVCSSDLSCRIETIDRDAAGETLASKIEDYTTREYERRLIQNRGDGPWTKKVLIELHPNKGKRIGRAIDVVDAAPATQDVAGGVERRFQCVIGALLPVARPRTARCTARRRWIRQRECAKRRRVGNTGLLRRQYDHSDQRDHSFVLMTSVPQS